MQVLTASLDYSQFVSRIGQAPARVLLLDYDGTLAPFHDRPECALPYPAVLQALRDILDAGGTRVVVISGRPASEVPPLLGLPKCPEIWGSHGWETLMPDGTTESQRPTPSETVALEYAATAIQEAVGHGGRVERKVASIALHWRGLDPRAQQLCERTARTAWAQSQLEVLELLEFDGGLELRASGCNKQHAVKAVLATAPNDAAIAYLGDDITDEDAFRAVKARGIALLVRPTFRPTVADVWLTPPDELADFLRLWRVPDTHVLRP